MESCSTELLPNYNYEHSILVVGVYRPPDAKCPPQQEAMDRMLFENRTRNITTFILGYLNISAWDREYTERITNEELWVLPRPQIPTHHSGTVEYAALVAVGNYVPEGILSEGGDLPILRDRRSGNCSPHGSDVGTMYPTTALRGG